MVVWRARADGRGMPRPRGVGDALSFSGGPMGWLATIALLCGLPVVVTVALVRPRLGLRATSVVVVAAVVLTGAFAYAVAAYWLVRQVDGPGQGLYFLFLLLPVALVATTVGGLATAWHRRRRGATPRRAVSDATAAIALLLAALLRPRGLAHRHAHAAERAPRLRLTTASRHLVEIA